MDRLYASPTDLCQASCLIASCDGGSIDQRWNREGCVLAYVLACQTHPPSSIRAGQRAQLVVRHFAYLRRCQSRLKVHLIAYLKLLGVVKLSAGGQCGASFCARKEVTTRHRTEIFSSSGLRTPTENLIRKLVAKASSESEAIGKETNHRKGQVIIDTEIDGVHCLLTRLDKPSAPRVSFSPRESEIARMVAKGYPNKAIAAALDISPWTVGTHLRRVFAKLHVSSRSAMVARLINTGVVNDFL